MSANRIRYVLIGLGLVAVVALVVLRCRGDGPRHEGTDAHLDSVSPERGEDEVRDPFSMADALADGASSMADALADGASTASPEPDANEPQSPREPAAAEATRDRSTKDHASRVVEQEREIQAVTLLARSGRWREGVMRADALAEVAVTPEIRCAALVQSANLSLRDGDPDTANATMTVVDAECPEFEAMAATAARTRRGLADLMSDASVGRARDLVRLELWEQALDEAMAVIDSPDSQSLESTCEAFALAIIAIRRGHVELPGGFDPAQRFDAECRSQLGSTHWIVFRYGALTRLP